MPQGRYPRRGSSASSLDDYSRSPSPAYTRSPSRSRGGRRNSLSRSPSRSRPQSRRTSRRDSSSSRSSSRSPSRRDKSKRTQLKEQFKDKTETTSGLKTSLVFLGSVAAATYAAHKFWPKGITYGEKEEWEIEKATKKEKAKKVAEWEDDGRHGGPSRRGNDRLGPGDRRGDRDYGRPRSSQGRLGIEDVPRIPGDPHELDEVVVVRRPAGTNRNPEGATVMSQVSGSRTGDARRAQYVEDNRTVRGDRRSYVQAQDTQDDNYGAPTRFVDYESRSRRYSHDEPHDSRRGERVVYMRQDDNYR
ncbi:hypothetical protein AB5N19_03882 [Seiridium cardinale]